MHQVTVRALGRRVKADDLAILLGCTPQHAADIFSGAAVAQPRETAIVRMCANIRPDRLDNILSDLQADYEWKRIPGFSRYEASAFGQVRRAVNGHGSMPGHVLRARASRWGHLYVNIAPDGGPVRAVGVHVAVCLAFHGLPPSPLHIVCHKDDVKGNNTPPNLYWGTHQDNAQDRRRNWKPSLPEIDTRLAQSLISSGEMTPNQVKKAKKKQMDKRMQRA